MDGILRDLTSLIDADVSLLTTAGRRYSGTLDLVNIGRVKLLNVEIADPARQGAMTAPEVNISIDHIESWWAGRSS